MKQQTHTQITALERSVKLLGCAGVGYGGSGGCVWVGGMGGLGHVLLARILAIDSVAAPNSKNSNT